MGGGRLTINGVGDNSCDNPLNRCKYFIFNSTIIVVVCCHLKGYRDALRESLSPHRISSIKIPTPCDKIDENSTL